ncbi:MAG: SAP domain-containing protein [Syntrophales bacterium]|jgi:hypothetical protein
MKIQEIRKIAKKWGVDTKVGRKKEDIIRDIQMCEGYAPCFCTKDSCVEDCLWKEDCVNLK